MRQLWQEVTKDLLRNIELKRKAYHKLLAQLQRLEEEYERLKGPVLSDIAVQGGMLNKEEERRLNNLVEREELEMAADLLKLEIEAFEEAWKELTPKEQTVLTYFYISRTHDYLDRLCEMYHCEKTKIYNIKDEALYKLTMLRYGQK